MPPCWPLSTKMVYCTALTRFYLLDASRLSLPTDNSPTRIVNLLQTLAKSFWIQANSLEIKLIQLDYAVNPVRLLSVCSNQSSIWKFSFWTIHSSLLPNKSYYPLCIRTKFALQANSLLIKFRRRVNHRTHTVEYRLCLNCQVCWQVALVNEILSENFLTKWW